MLIASMRTDHQMRKYLRVNRSGFLEQVLRNKNEIFISGVEVS